MSRIIATRFCSADGKITNFRRGDIVILPDTKLGEIVGFEVDRQCLVIDVPEGEFHAHTEYWLPEMVRKVNPAVAKIWRSCQE